MKYFKFGSGKKTMVIIPGLSFKPVSDNPKFVIKAYKIFHDEYTTYLFDREENIDENYSIEDMADDTVKKINELNLKDIYLFGVSQGGMISQYIAIKYPDLIKKLILASTTSKFDNQNIDEMMKLIEEKDIQSLADNFSKYIYSEKYYRLYKIFMKASYKKINDEDLRRFKIMINSILNFDVSDRLNEIKASTLVLGSKKDKLIDYHQMIKIAENINNCQIYLYHDYSHAVYDEAKDFKVRLKEFFDE